MWTYERRLEYPVKICKPDPNAAQVIISQLGGNLILQVKDSRVALDKTLANRVMI